MDFVAGKNQTSVDEQYITQRVIDACLRENVRNITDKGQPIHAKKTGEVLLKWPHQLPEYWLKINHLGDFTIWLPIEKTQFMQLFKATTAAWLITRNHEVTYANGYQNWLTLLSQNLPISEQDYYQNYIDECHCATAHRAFAKNIFEQKSQVLNQSIFSYQDAWDKLSFTEQLGAHLDHPLYPTARAKFGIEEHNITQYCPEAMHSFELNWLAVPKFLCVNSTEELPKYWPSFNQIGLQADLAHSHQLIPVHPLTFNRYLPEVLMYWKYNADIYFAPFTHLMVKPTLSVRTLMLITEPNIHLKLPLPMRTLGSKNIRTIKPSTINDGFVFQQILQHIAEYDSQLTSLYIHSHEEQGGCVDNRADLAWLIREYPQQVDSTTPICIASLMAENPDGILVIEQLAQYYFNGDITALLSQYFTLLLKVHLRLWLVYGIALESNQQNSLVLFSAVQPLTLLFRDNDSGRIYPSRLLKACPELSSQLTTFIDQRILVNNEEALLQMFTTITLQLNMTCLINDLENRQLVKQGELYQLLTEVFINELKLLNEQGITTNYVDEHLLKSPLHHAKYLLTAGSLLSKENSHAADINKFYGFTAPNPLLGRGVV